jgi:ATP-dependent Zn protease
VLEVATHEAGHTVVAHYYRVPITSAEIFPSTEDTSGHGVTVFGEGPSSHEIEAAICYAGLAAERRVNPKAEWGIGCARDMRQMLKHLETMYPYSDVRFDRGCDDFFNSTLRLVNRLRPHIETLAKQLLEHSRLSGKQVNELLKGCPQIPP